MRFKRKIDIKIDIFGDNGAMIISDDTVCYFLDKSFTRILSWHKILNANDLFKPVP